MTSNISDWIAPTGVRRIAPDTLSTQVPETVLSDTRLSLTAKGLYALLLTYQGRPVDPYEDALEDEAEIRAAIDELIAFGYAVRVEV